MIQYIDNSAARPCNSSFYRYRNFDFNWYKTTILVKFGFSKSFYADPAEPNKPCWHYSLSLIFFRIWWIVRN